MNDLSYFLPFIRRVQSGKLVMDYYPGWVWKIIKWQLTVNGAHNRIFPMHKDIPCLVHAECPPLSTRDDFVFIICQHVNECIYFMDF